MSSREAARELLDSESGRVTTLRWPKKLEQLGPAEAGGKGRGGPRYAITEAGLDRLAPGTLFWIAASAASVADSSVPAVRSGSAAAVTIMRNLLQPQVPGRGPAEPGRRPGHPRRAGGTLAAQAVTVSGLRVTAR